MMHTNLFEMMDDIAAHVERMRRDAKAIIPEIQAITLRVQADAIERRFLTDEQTGEVFPHLSERTVSVWIARVFAQQESERAKAGGLR